MVSTPCINMYICMYMSIHICIYIYINTHISTICPTHTHSLSLSVSLELTGSCCALVPKYASRRNTKARRASLMRSSLSHTFQVYIDP